MYNQGDGGNIYWNEKGESMRKAFLKAPLKFSRISSGFSYARRHPVTRKVRPHTGVDYAAPKGTPVMTIGDGTVTSIKYEGAGGKTVRIRHNSVYSTAYLHLSGYAKGLKVGQRVRQGQVIGYVGSTGRSTGPHLDFRVWKNGSPINPLKMQSPPAEPIKSSSKDAFAAAHEKYKAQIDTIQARSVALELFDLL
jgi:murein DD-endopeptidase MepM/ murein hydrolase activator NlpD